MDPARLQQAVAAVLDNAAKYSPDDAPIEVRIDQVRDRVRLTIADHGPGIPVSERQRVFDKFHRLDPEMATGVGGCGLGLHIARGLVEAMSGRIWIESTSANGSGATMVIALRAADLALRFTAEAPAVSSGALP